MKKKLLKSVAFVGLLLVTLMISSSAYALPTLVQFDPTGNSSYSITGIHEFDWASSGNLVIEQDLVSYEAGDGTLAGFFADPNLALGDTLTMNIHAQAYLGGFLDVHGVTIPVPSLNSDYEVTATLDGQETAVYGVNPGTGAPMLYFTGITGTFQYYLDTNVNSAVSTGVGFNDGDIGNPFMAGTLISTGGTFDGGTGEGSSYLENSITSYDSSIIETDPAALNNWLIGTNFDTTIQFIKGLQPSVGVGGYIGNTPYTVGDYDLILNADASSNFSSVPEPATLMLLGLGLLVLAGFSRKKFNN